MRRNGGNQQKEYEQDRISGIVIAAAVLLSLLINGFGFLHAQSNLQRAAQTAAQVEQQEKGLLSDPLLVVVNSCTPLPEDWKITPRMIHDEVVDIRAYGDLVAMFDAAAEENIWFWVVSGYRSPGQQEIVLDRAIQANENAGMTATEAEEDALRTVAQPGYSEHHTGLAVDFNDVTDAFEKSDAYRWLTEHAAEYGFVQRYKKEKSAVTGIDRESWHYRYVGKDHAQEMERLNYCLEEYVEYLKKQGSE